MNSKSGSGSFGSDDETSRGAPASNDLGPIEIMDLLRTFRNENMYVDNDLWTDDIIAELEEIIDLIQFKDYEPILEEGEDATFVGFVLAGSIEVLIEGAKVATLTHGHFVGEMSLFTGLKRNADVIAAQQGATIGVIRFDVLDSQWEERPRLVVALMTAMGSAAVHHAAENAARNAKNGNDDDTCSSTLSLSKLSKEVGRRSSITRSLQSSRMSVVESARKEVVYRTKFTDLRKSEQRHQSARQKAERLKKKAQDKNKQERLKFQQKERHFIEAETALEQSLQSAVDERNSLMNQSTNRKIDEDAMNRQLRRNLEQTKKKLDQMKIKLKTAHLRSAVHQKKYEKLCIKAKAEKREQRQKNTQLQQNLDVMAGLVRHYESHGDHDSLVQKVRDLSTNVEVLKEEKHQMSETYTNLLEDMKQLKENGTEKKAWYKQVIWRLVHEKKKNKRVLSTYHGWANEQIVWLEEQLSERTQEFRDVEIILNVEVEKSRQKLAKYNRFVDLAKQETRRVQEKLEHEIIIRKNIEEQKKRAEKATQVATRRISFLHGRLLLWWFAMWTQQIVCRKQQQKSTKQKRKLEIKIKALRDRLHVFKSNAEENSCKQRSDFKEKLLILQQQLAVANEENQKHLDIGRRNVSRHHEKAYDYQQQIQYLKQKIKDVEMDKRQACSREKLALNEMTDKLNELERLKEKLDWCLQRLRVSEWRRTEIEKSFGSLSKPSHELESAIKTIRDRRNDQDVVSGCNDYEEEKKKEKEKEEEGEQQQEENEQEGGSRIMLPNDDSISIQDSEEDLMDVTLESPKKYLTVIQKRSWKQNASSSLNNRQFPQQQRQQRPSTSSGTRHIVPIVKKERSTHGSSDSGMRGRSNSAHPMRRLSSSTRTLSNKKTKNVINKKQWISPFLAKRTRSAHLTRNHRRRSTDSYDARRSAPLKRPTSSSVEVVTSVHERLHMSNSMLDWNEHTAFQSFHVAVLVIASDSSEQAMLHQCLNASGVGVAICKSLSSAHELFKNGKISNYHVVVVSETLAGGSALDVLHAIMQGAVQDAHRALETYDMSADTMQFPETRSDGINKMSEAFQRLQNVPEIIVLGKKLRMGESLHRQKFKHISSGAFRYIPHPVCKGDILSAVDASIAKLVVAPYEDQTPSPLQFAPTTCIPDTDATM